MKARRVVIALAAAVLAALAALAWVRHARPPVAAVLPALPRRRPL